jgi:hypothetical protein
MTKPLLGNDAVVIGRARSLKRANYLNFCQFLVSLIGYVMQIPHYLTIFYITSVPSSQFYVLNHTRVHVTWVLTTFEEIVQILFFEQYPTASAYPST